MLELQVLADSSHLFDLSVAHQSRKTENWILSILIIIDISQLEWLLSAQAV